MNVQWSYEGLSYQHTLAEIDDPECHEWQGPMGADELIVHAANLYLMRSGDTTSDGLPLWSLNRKAEPLPDRAYRPEGSNG